jgi:hypothetical protein
MLGNEYFPISLIWLPFAFIFRFQGWTFLVLRSSVFLNYPHLFFDSSKSLVPHFVFVLSLFLSFPGCFVYIGGPWCGPGSMKPAPKKKKKHTHTIKREENRLAKRCAFQ